MPPSDNRHCQTCTLPLSPDGICLQCALGGSTKRVADTEASTELFAGYELLEEIGQDGGMGTVYKARDPASGRVVALKMVRIERLRSEEMVRRFQIEIEAAANLDHPHILPIYDIGEFRGHHYYTMRLAAGGSLASQMAAGLWKISTAHRSQSTEQQHRIARFLSQVAMAVQHAHEHGILHRDLKPGNILLDQNGTPYVADFGLAKRLNTTSDLTRTQGMIGTPAYMAPEQAVAGGRDVTARTDVWALGTILYELLTGASGFAAASPIETLESVRSREPSRPRLANPLLDRDLEIICLKCLEKDPRRRYATAGDLAADLQNFLGSLPISARYPTRWENVQKWWRRNPVLAPMSVGTLLILVMGLVATSWQWRRAEAAGNQERLHASAALAAQRVAEDAQKQEYRARQQAERDRLETLEMSYAADMSSACHLLENSNDQAALTILERYRPGDPAKDLRGVEWSILQSIARRSYLGQPTVEFGSFTAFHQTTTDLLSGHHDGSIVQWQAKEGAWTPLRRWNAHAGPISSLSVSTGSPPRLLSVCLGEGVRIWNLSTGSKLADIPFDRPQASLSQDGSLLVVTTAIHHWGSSPESQIRGISLDDRIEKFRFAGGRHAVSPRGDLVACADNERETIVLRRTDGSLHRAMERSSGFFPRACNAMSFVRGDDALAASTWDGGIFLWNTRTGELSAESKRSDQVHQLHWFAEGGLIFAGSGPQVLRLSADDLSEVQPPLKTALSIGLLLPIQDPTPRLLISGTDGTLSTWSMAGAHQPGNRRIGLSIPDDGLGPIMPRGSGSIIGARGTIRTRSDTIRWSPIQGGPDELLSKAAGTAPIAYLPATRTLIVRRNSKELDACLGKLLFLREDGPTTEVDLPDPAEEPQDDPPGEDAPPYWLISASSQSSDGRLIALGNWSGDMAVLDVDRRLWVMKATLPADYRGPDRNINSLEFSPDSRHLAVATGFSDGFVFDVGTGKLVGKIRGHLRKLVQLLYSTDGQSLYSCSFDGTIRRWSASDWTETGVLRGHSQAVVGISLSRDGRRLASIGDDRTLRLWHLGTARELMTWPLKDGFQQFVGFLDDGSLVSPDPWSKGILHWPIR